MPSESWIPMEESRLQEWQSLVSDYPGHPYYKFLTNEQIPSTIPHSLKTKINHAVLMVSGTSLGEVMLVCNLCRVDLKDTAIDQQPFAIVLDGHGHSQSGVYLDLFPVIPSGSETGALSSLHPTSHGAAFSEMVRRCRDAGSLKH
jgi:hypothetical protein